MDCFHPVLCVDPVNPCNRVWRPCGQCMACRINRTSEWTMRLLHENQYWKESVFVTLTYDEYNLPTLPCGKHPLLKSDVQNFTNNIRNHFRGTDRKFKYFCAGEYGDKSRTFRPHYHLIMFGLSVKDYDLINICWQKGRIDVGSVTNKSCNYVTGYIQKKFSGRKAVEEYGMCLPPPFQLQSQGLGLQYALDHEYEIFTRGLRVNGKRVSVPRYYSKKSDFIKGCVDVHCDHRDQVIEAKRIIARRMLNDEQYNEYLLQLMSGPTKQDELDLKKRFEIHHRQKL